MQQNQQPAQGPSVQQQTQPQQMQMPQAQAQPEQQRPADLPPVSPKISYQNGLLTVQAPNSTLSDILNGIRRQAGIQFEGAQGAYERVAANFGPAPADEVLTSLLRGSRFDYVIVGSPENPDIVQRVILTPRNGGPTPVAGTAPPGRPGMSPQPGGGDPEDEAEENNNVPSETVQPDQPQQPAQVQQPQMQLPTDQGENAPKTTEQLLEELKQMQQQQQNQQNPQNQPTSPLKTGVPNQPPPVRRIPQ